MAAKKSPVKKRVVVSTQLTGTASSRVANRDEEEIKAFYSRINKKKRAAILKRSGIVTDDGTLAPHYQ